MLSYLKECLNFYLSVNGKQCNTTLIYLSLNQLLDEFYAFLTNFELLQDNVANLNPFVSITIDDFNSGQKIGALVIKQFMKVKNLNPWLPSMDLN